MMIRFKALLAMSLQRYLGEIREVIASDELCLACAKEAEDLARYIAGNLDKRCGFHVQKS